MSVGFGLSSIFGCCNYRKRQALAVIEHVKQGEAQYTASTSSSLPPQARQDTSSTANPRSPFLCDRCWDGPFSELGFQQVLRFSGSPKKSSYTYTISWSALSAAADCRWCQLLLSTRTDSDVTDEIKVAVGIRSDENKKITPPNAQRLSVFINDFDYVHLVGYVSAEADDPAAEHIIARSRILKVNSPGARLLALQSIENCTTKHERCPAVHDLLFPTRLIDCADPTHPRLVTTEGETGRYVALSYVWGEPQPHSTTTVNAASYALGITLSVLPQTIKDAISLTYDLGQRYLWVDTLCIIQDSDDDKDREIARMRRTFRDAYLTLVAASATKVGGGFLQDRAPPSPPDIQLAFQLPSQRLGTFYLSVSWKYAVPPDKEDGEQYNPSIEPVNKRGWCLQEYLLAPRALVFASHTVQYHCQTSIVNVGDAFYYPETDIQRLPDIIFNVDAYHGVDSSTSPHLSLSPEEWDATREAWFGVLDSYTQRFVTVPDDKLVAFAGIAEQFYRVWNTPYLAGLWQDTLFEDLFWHKRPSTRASFPRPTQYRAPSWSWASVDGGVQASVKKWVGSGGRCEIIRCEVTLANPELPFGQVTAGTLVIRAPLVKATWTPHELEYYVSTPGVIDDLDSDESSDSSNGLEHIGRAWIDSSDDSHLREVWAVPLMWERPSIVTGLVLALAGPGVSDNCQPRYRRIGFLQTSASSEGLEWFDRVEPVEIVIV